MKESETQKEREVKRSSIFMGNHWLYPTAWKAEGL